jgi:hypothetical protein
MPRGVSRDAKHFRDVLEEGVILVDGGADGVIDIGAGPDDPVWVGIMVDVMGYGPHTGTIYAYQNRYHGNPDEPLQEAETLLEDWEREHFAEDQKERFEEYLKELEEEHPDMDPEERESQAWQQADEASRETHDGWSFRLNPREFGDAIRGTKAAKYIDVHDSHAERREELQEKLADLRRFYARYEDEISPKEVRERSDRIERLLAAGDLDAAEREIDALDKL